MPTTTKGGATAAPTEIKTLDDFAGAVLGRLGVPDTAANRGVIVGWAQVENTAAHNNPLATTYRANGLPSAPLPGNSSGVQEYASAADGVTATAATLEGYPSILAAFRTGNALSVMFNNGRALIADFAKWSGNAQNPAGARSYFDKVKVRAQGGSTSGSLSATDFGSYDLGTLATDTKNAVAAATGLLTTGPVLQILLYGLFTLTALGLIVLALSRATGAAPGPAGYARKLISRGAKDDIPF